MKNVIGNKLTVDNTIRRHYPAASNATIKQIHAIQGVGIECLYMERIDSTAQQTNNIDFTYAANCWVTGIESNMTNFSHIAVNYSTHILIRGNYFHHAHAYGEGGQAYGTTLEYASGDCLIENNIFEHLRHSILVQAGANGNVFAYNYSTDPYWTQPPLPTNSAGDIVCHGNYPYLNLFEGNIIQNIVVDESHGINGPYNTFYRNRAELYGIFTVAAASDSQNYAANEITNATGYYLLTGLGFFESGNNVKGTIMPVNSPAPAENSLHRGFPPGYWPSQSAYPSIGTPHPYNQGTNAAKQRFSSSQKTDCRRNPVYVTVQSIANTPGITIVPNPFYEAIHIKTGYIQDAQYSLYNITGRIILSGKVPGNDTIINTSSIPTGLYILEISDNNGYHTYNKLLKAE
ncbi:MAG: T9SS type A sorting domain-containing protein [Taibaiella sp.]|nr:T9SS type A sorting domain-containing protein [Taibaiella sp.]